MGISSILNRFRLIAASIVAPRDHIVIDRDVWSAYVHAERVEQKL